MEWNQILISGNNLILNRSENAETTNIKTLKTVLMKKSKFFFVLFCQYWYLNSWPCAY
jgi:hypothetical protein